MYLEPTEIDGVFVARLEPVGDDRGTFTRTFSAQLFAEHGLDPTVVECGRSTNDRAATLRGMHLQVAPFGETKFVRCISGRVFDVAADTRLDSPTFGQWFGLELDSEQTVGVVLSPGIAHGFITLVDDAELSYQISIGYQPDAAAGFHWDDPAVGIQWPVMPRVISERDQQLPTLAELVGAVTK